MTDFTKFLLKAFLRKGLTALGAILLTYGVLTGKEAEGFVDAYLEELVGAALLGGSTLWTYAYQAYVRRKVLAAKSLPADASREQLEVATEAAKG